MRKPLFPLLALALAGCATTTTRPEEGLGRSDSAGAEATAKLPKSLDTDAYRYYGLSYSQPINMEVVASTNPAIQTGTQTIRLKEVKGDKAIFTIGRTGNLEALLGDMEVRLQPDGVYVESSSLAKVGSSDVEMPAGLTPGKRWTTKTIVDRSGQQMDVTNAFKVVGPESVTTAVGTYPDALLVTSAGTGTLNGQKVRMETRSWYVKDRGNVKAVLTTFDPAGQKSEITVSEAK